MIVEGDRPGVDHGETSVDRDNGVYALKWGERLRIIGGKFWPSVGPFEAAVRWWSDLGSPALEGVTERQREIRAALEMREPAQIIDYELPTPVE